MQLVNSDLPAFFELAEAPCRQVRKGEVPFAHRSRPLPPPAGLRRAKLVEKEDAIPTTGYRFEYQANPPPKPMTKKPHRPMPMTRYPLIAVVIVTAMGCASTRAEDGMGLATIAKWDFGSEEDTKADRWPDGWTRRTDFRHPGFIPVQIDRKSSMGLKSAEAENIRRTLAKLYLGWQTQRSPWAIIPETIPPPIEKFVENTLIDPYLRIDMDGSAAEVLSPKIAVDDNSLYGLQIDTFSDSADFEAKGSLRFFDRADKLIFEIETSPTRGGAKWESRRTLGTYEAPSGIASIQVALTVDPISPRATSAIIGFDRIRVIQMPRIRLALDRPTRLYRPNENVKVTLFASGLLKSSTRVDLMLYDHEGQVIATESKELVNAHMVSTSSTNRGAEARRWIGTCEWDLSHLKSGYYEIASRLERSNSVFVQNRETFAVIAPSLSPALDPRFGWSLDERVLDWRLDQLITLVREGGTGFIKLPIWFDAKDPIQEDRICHAIDRIQDAGIRCVGIIHRPLTQQPANSLATSALEDPIAWQPQLEPVFRSMCMRLFDFQVGRDQDTQYGSNPRYEDMLSWIKQILQRYGSESTLTVARNPWLPETQSKSIDRWQWSFDETIAESEWTQVVGDTRSRFPDWTCITPASAEKYSLSTRTKDLAARMIASIRPWSGRATIGWIRKPFSSDTGFLTPDGAPREMFLPYRTLVEAIKKREYVGELVMEGATRNAMLVSDTDCCFILWSPVPVTEQFYLGDHVQATDVWGRHVDLDRIETPFGPEHRLQLDKWPIIIRGIDTEIARWRMGLSMEQQRLDSVIGLPQQLQVRFNNPFAISVSGQIDLVAPSIFANETESSPLYAAASSEVTVPIDVLLRPDATSQETPVRVVVSLNTAPPKRFSLVRPLRIGNDDVEFETAYRVSETDELWLDLDAINHTDDPTSFDCQLFIPERRNERIQIISVENRKTRTIVLPRASELMHKSLWLRCSQVGTRRILNYRIDIEPESDNVSPSSEESAP